MKSAVKQKDPTVERPKGTVLRRHIKRFIQREDGSLLVFGLILFVLMLMVGGLALDIILYEQRRTQLQQTLDRSVLAAASLNQGLDPESVVRDYFDKAGLSEYLDTVVVGSNTDAERNVTATASATLPGMFLPMMGVSDLPIDTGATAAERVTNIEISLVLDVSGSMDLSNRLINLRPAAREFVTTVLNGSPPGRVSISIIPYNAQVNIGSPMMGAFNVTPIQNRSYCIELPGSMYNSIDVSLTSPLLQTSYFDPYNSDSGQPFRISCNPDPNNIVTPVSDNEQVLHTAINNLTALGSTSTEIGIKWGALLLNSNASSVVSELIDEGAVDPRFAGRPGVASSDVRKIMVVMSDGENTIDYNQINDPYRTGLSPFFRNGAGRLVYFDGTRPANQQWYWVDRGTRNPTEGPDAGPYLQQEWQQVWENYKVVYINNIITRATGINPINTLRTTTNATEKNIRMNNICNAAKAAGIEIYGIGFEAPQAGRVPLQACASTAAHYFNANGLQISTVFRAIASNINQLTLTQ